jgi:chromate reductase
VRVLGISGSLRGDSSNHALLRAIAQVAPGCTVAIYDGRALVRDADALVISSPEYAHGIPGSLKNALDWLVSGVEIVGKPTLVWSASPSGAHHAHPQLVEVLRTMSADVLIEAALQLTSARRAFHPDGSLIDGDLGRTLAKSLSRLRERLAEHR